MKYLFLVISIESFLLLPLPNENVIYKIKRRRVDISKPCHFIGICRFMSIASSSRATNATSDILPRRQFLLGVVCWNRLISVFFLFFNCFVFHIISRNQNKAIFYSNNNSKKSKMKLFNRLAVFCVKKINNIVHIWGSTKLTIWNIEHVLHTIFLYSSIIVFSMLFI